MKKTVIIIVLAAVSVFASCEKDALLDTIPTGSVSTSAVWTKATLARNVVTGIYNEFYSLYTYTGSGQGDSWRNVFEGYSSVMDIDKNWREHYLVIYGSGTSSSGDVSGMFKFWYTIVFRANDVVSHIGAVPDMDEAEKERLTCEALFLRAWAYYNLNVLWGGVPVYKEYVGDSKTATKPRSTEAEVWQEIIEDLDVCVASKNFPDMYAAADASYGRATKGAAYALQGIVYQWMQDWDKALACFEAVEKCGFSLYSGDWADLLHPQNERCSEMIFSVQCVAESGMGNIRGRSFGNRDTGGSGWNNYLPNPGFVDSFENADGSPFSWEDYIPGWNSMTPEARSVFFLRDGMTTDETEKMRAYGADMSKYLTGGNEARIRKAYDSRDPRLKKTVITPYATYLGSISNVERTLTLRWPYRKDSASPWDIRTDTNSMFYYLWRKYVPVGNECTTAWLYEQDIILLRYAEILLRRAECLNELDRPEEAIAIVNQIRKRAGAVTLNNASYPATTVGDKDNLRTRIQNEFYWELGGEDSMYYNELRWGVWKDRKFRDRTRTDAPMSSNGLKQIWGSNTYNWIFNGDYVRYWPIPAKEREMNPALTQNPGWND